MTNIKNDEELSDNEIKNINDTGSYSMFTFMVEKFDLPQEFLSNLLKEDDWSFIIKSHAFIEASFTYVLTTIFPHFDLEDVFSNMEMSNNKTGKIRFAKQCGLIDDDMYNFVRSLSEIRNEFVHKSSNITATIKSFINGSNYNKYRNAFQFGFRGDYDKFNSTKIQEFKEDSISNYEEMKKTMQCMSVILFEDSPKTSIYCGIMLCTSHIGSIVKSFEVSQAELGKFEPPNFFKY